MDLKSLKISLDDHRHRVEVVLRDAGGEHTAALSGDGADRVLAAAEPLLVRLAQEGGGPLRTLSIDADAQVLHAACLSNDGEPTPAMERALRHQHGVNMHEVGEVRPHTTHLRIDGPEYRRLLSLLREPARVAAREARPRRPDPADLHEPSALWEHKYHEGRDGWELGRPAPPLARWLAAHPPAPGTRALVPGCGRGHEAHLLARAGAAVVAVDFAPTAVAETRRRAQELGLSLEALQADLFALPPEHDGRYDLVLEHCCFCAIDPARRDEYVDVVARLLRPGGTLLGLFWCHPYPGGPPWGMTPEELAQRFTRRFAIVHEEVPHDSIITRAGHERLLLLRPLPAAPSTG